jgi:hypothetical protein
MVLHRSHGMSVSLNPDRPRVLNWFDRLASHCHGRISLTIKHRFFILKCYRAFFMMDFSILKSSF